MKKFKQYCFLMHRWLGIALCLFMTLWFASGVVMMYVEYPELTEAERRQSLANLNWKTLQPGLETVANNTKLNSDIKKITLSSIGNHAAFYVTYQNNHSEVIYANNGKPFNGLNAEQLTDIGLNFQSQASPELRQMITVNQWTMSSRLDRHRPLYQVDLHDEKGTILYVSSHTGQLVRDTNSWEIAWNWVGSTIHWIYPMQFRLHASVWANTIIYLSLAGIFVLVTGTLIGYWRLRVQPRYNNGSVTPYTGMRKWHHLSGLACVLFISTFMVSGLFSMNPFGIFNDKSSARDPHQRYEGTPQPFSVFQQHLFDYLNGGGVVDDLKELSWTAVNGNGVLVATTSKRRFAVNITDESLQRMINDSVNVLMPEHSLLGAERLDEYDNYYYSTHNRYKPLPVYRFRFNDSEKSWFYIDSATGELLGRSTHIKRVQRWLYNGLHSLDFQFLLTNRPLWDIVVLLLSICGLFFCSTSLTIAWRRLKPQYKFIKHKLFGK